MSEHSWLRGAMLVAFILFWPGVPQAQMHHHPAAADTTRHHAAKPAAHQHRASSHEHMHGMDMSGMDMGEMPMTGMYGPYPMSREASGTSWQPEAARHEGVHLM